MNPSREIYSTYLSLCVDTFVILAWVIYKYGLAEMIPIGNLIIVTNIIMKLCIMPYLLQDTHDHIN